MWLEWLREAVVRLYKKNVTKRYNVSKNQLGGASQTQNPEFTRVYYKSNPEFIDYEA
jgi:hypothetical protein